MTIGLASDSDLSTPFAARGPLSSALLDVLSDRAPGRADELPQRASEAALTEDPIRDDDLQLSLFLLYAVAYGSIPAFGAHWEWDTSLITARAALERAFEDAVRAAVEHPTVPEPTREAVAAELFRMTAPEPGPSLSRFVSRKATVEQARELLIQRSIYTLREADAHSWAIPRLTGRAKVALVEIQADEYGGGRPDRMHQTMFARAMRGAGLDDTYGAYVDAVPAITLASFNLMTMFGMNRRLRGASVGHLAAFEMTSSLPCRAIAEGLRRVGFGDDVAAYYDEHVEADAVHEQIAGRDLAGSLAEDEPELLADILFGAAACLTVDGWGSEHILHCWERGESSLRGAADTAR
ncbi:iron-containing redox enzyme family protein [Microbacterium sp. NPDC058345]|uniref:iron-containing redox enzyme family protein n=1 Tax=Microbacterium sp. NPDC058345 TaxID=3346455 RepID=UPI003658AF7A